MRESTIARNYAGALFELGRKTGDEDAFGAALHELAVVLMEDERVRRFLETPRLDAGTKTDALRRALGGRAPDAFLRFLAVVVRKNRQRLLPEIGRQYDAILDEQAGRVHAQITLAREPDDATRRELAERLSSMLGKEVVPHITVNPSILGGLVVRFGDRVLDGSVRRQLVSLKRDMMRARLPERPASAA